MSARSVRGVRRRSQGWTSSPGRGAVTAALCRRTGLVRGSQLCQHCELERGLTAPLRSQACSCRRHRRQQGTSPISPVTLQIWVRPWVCPGRPDRFIAWAGAADKRSCLFTLTVSRDCAFPALRGALSVASLSLELQYRSAREEPSQSRKTTLPGVLVHTTWPATVHHPLKC